MMTKLDALIDQLLQEVRVYEELVYKQEGDEVEGYTEVIQEQSGEDYARRLEWKPEERGRRFCAARHQLFAPPLGFSLNQYFPPGLPPEVALPPDVEHFYQRICHARLRWKKDYVLDPPGWSGKDQIWGKVEPPNFLLRFCEIGVEDFYALRTEDNGAHWDVIIVMGDDSDTNLAIENATLDASFTEWLERMMKSDGWPPDGGDPETKEEDSPFYLQAERRLPTEEVIRKFGLPEKLLPPPRMETWQEGLK